MGDTNFHYFTCLKEVRLIKKKDFTL